MANNKHNINVFKSKLSRAMLSLQLCRFKNPSSLVETPLPSRAQPRLLSPYNTKALDISFPARGLPAPPPSTPDQPLFWSAVKCRRPHDPSRPTCSSQYDYSDLSCDFSNDSMEFSFIKKRENDHVETDSLLFSSRSSFSYDSSYEFTSYPLSNRITAKFDTETNNNKKSCAYYYKKKLAAQQVDIRMIRDLNSKKGNQNSNSTKNYLLGRNKDLHPSCSERDYALRRWEALKESCEVDGEVKESVAVVKKSLDPYEDFKRSMLEMVLEKEMFEAEDLEQLLHWFLSLNSRQFHGIIVDAFTEVWKFVFVCDSHSHISNKAYGTGRF